MKSIEEAAREYSNIDKDLIIDIGEAARECGNIDKDLIIDTEERYYKNFQKYDGFKAGVEFSQKWFDIYEEEPEYYQRILADNGEYMSVAARVSDGEEDSYIIHGTDFYMNPNPIRWKLIELKDIDIENLQTINGQNQLSKDIQAQLILFEGQCKMNAMLACNMQRGACNVSIAYNDYDFIDLQKQIECRINELKQK